jgi:uncharacterized protein YjbI with pentapeptide repeats
VIVALAIGTLLLLLLWLGYTQGWKSGFDTKTLWDWMELLIIPVVLTIGGVLFSQAEREAERKAADRRAEAEREIADDRNRETTLQNYLDKMTELLLEKDLSNPEASPSVQEIARARTVATLRQMDSNRNNLLLGFLRQVHLINIDDRVQLLKAADLSGANLCKANLHQAALSDTNLHGANLSGADLSETDLSAAILTNANLSRGYLRRANLSGADLSEADLSEAGLPQIDLSRANLSRAVLCNTYLHDAVLTWANLSNANLSGAFLHGAHYNDDTTWPEGFTPPSDALRKGILD